MRSPWQGWSHGSEQPSTLEQQPVGTCSDAKIQINNKEEPKKVETEIATRNIMYMHEGVGNDLEGGQLQKDALKICMWNTVNIHDEIHCS